MPKYVIRMAGETAKPGGIANVNPFVVVCFVSFITRLMAKRSAITSMNVGMFLIPFSALLMACGNLLGNDIISGMSNITLMMVAGIIVQALAECFISPRYLEYFSLQAPKGEEGMYLGFSHLHSFLSSIKPISLTFLSRILLKIVTASARVMQSFGLKVLSAYPFTHPTIATLLIASSAQ